MYGGTGLTLIPRSNNCVRSRDGPKIRLLASHVRCAIDCATICGEWRSQSRVTA